MAMELSELEKVIVNYLATRQEDEILGAIRNNIDLSQEILRNVEPEMIKLIRIITMSVFRNDGLNSDTILEYISVYNPKIVKIIRETKEGVKWYDRQVKNVKRMFGL